LPRNSPACSRPGALGRVCVCEPQAGHAPREERGRLYGMGGRVRQRANPMPNRADPLARPKLDLAGEVARSLPMAVGPGAGRLSRLSATRSGRRLTIAAERHRNGSLRRCAPPKGAHLPPASDYVSCGLSRGTRVPSGARLAVGHTCAYRDLSRAPKALHQTVPRLAGVARCRGRASR
jgi:hypothetical protein